MNVMCLPYNSKLSSDSPTFLEHAACSALSDEKKAGDFRSYREVSVCRFENSPAFCAFK